MDAVPPTRSLGVAHLPALAGCAVVDTRPRDAAQASHLPGSTWLPVPDASSPTAALPSFLLPAPGSPLAVIAADATSALAIATHLRSRGYDAAYLAEPFPTPDQARAAGVQLATGLPTGHLWQPDPLLREHLRLLPPPGAGPGARLSTLPIVDLGCGNGRDAAFLALRGYDVLAVDRLPDALELTRRRAEHHAVTVRTLQVDLRRPPGLAQIEAAGPFAAALLIRVHQPDALRALARLLVPGGIAFVHAFSRRDPPAADHERRPKAALSLAALNAAFAVPDWQTLVAIDPPPDADRALAARIARRHA